MIAESMRGNGDRAYQYCGQINPAAKNDDIDRYECEPYCYAQNILGDEHVSKGLVSLVVDGRRVDEPHVAIFADGEVHDVEVEMGCGEQPVVPDDVVEVVKTTSSR